MRMRMSAVAHSSLVCGCMQGVNQVATFADTNANRYTDQAKSWQFLPRPPPPSQPYPLGLEKEPVGLKQGGVADDVNGASKACLGGQRR